MEPDYVYKGAVPFAETYFFNLKELGNCCCGECTGLNIGGVTSFNSFVFYFVNK